MTAGATPKGSITVSRARRGLWATSRIGSSESGKGAPRGCTCHLVVEHELYPTFLRADTAEFHFGPHEPVAGVVFTTDKL